MLVLRTVWSITLQCNSKMNLWNTPNNTAMWQKRNSVTEPPHSYSWLFDTSVNQHWVPINAHQWASKLYTESQTDVFLWLAALQDRVTSATSINYNEPLRYTIPLHKYSIYNKYHCTIISLLNYRIKWEKKISHLSGAHFNFTKSLYFMST